MAHMMNGFHKMLKNFIIKIIFFFLNDVPIKECEVKNKKDETLDSKGCKKFVTDHINDCEKILIRLEVHLILLKAKSIFGIKKKLVVRHMYWSYGCKLNIKKIDITKNIKKIYKHKKSQKIFKSMYSLSYIDISFCTYNRSIIWVVKKE